MIEVDLDAERKAAWYRKGYWRSDTLLDVWRRQVAAHGSKPYIIDGRTGEGLSYEQVDAQANALARHLRAAGVEEGEIITFQVPVWREFAVVMAACLKMGAVMHPVSMSFNERDLELVMNQVGSSAFICPAKTRKGDHESQALTLQVSVPSLKSIVVIGHGLKPASDLPAFEDIVESAQPERHGCSPESEHPDPHLGVQTSRKPLAPQKTSSDSVALILSTSGTTGTPKAVLLTHNNLLFSERSLTEELQIDEHDVMFMPAPLNHATGFNHGLIAPLLTGGSVVLQERFDSEEALAIMEGTGVTWSMGATPFVFDLLKQMEAGAPKPAALRFYLCGGAPLPGSFIQRAAKQGLVVCEVYGSTESCPHALVPPALAVQWNGRFSGRALDGIETKVVDRKRCAIEPGQVGEEASRGPHLFVGYLGDPGATAAVVDADGWFYSGDLCTADEQGRIRIMGRRKEIIIRGGKNISAVEIDNLVAGCPGIRDHAAVGFPDERLGERICLAAVPDGECLPTANDICAFLQAKGVQKRLWPERVVEVARIPRTESGKVRRNLLAQEALAKHAGSGRAAGNEKEAVRG